MKDQKVATLDQLRSTLRAALPGLETAAQDAVISVLASEFERVSPPGDAEMRGVHASLNERDAYYAIRQEDLKLLEQCAPIVGALYTFLTNPVALVGGLVVLLWRYRRHRIRLNGDQALILKTLTKAGRNGLSFDELVRDIPAKHLSPDKVTTILKALESVQKENNEFVPLVVENSGSWYAKDL